MCSGTKRPKPRRTDRSHGQVALFAEALATAGVFDRRVQACLLHHSSPNVSRPRGVPGALMLGILAGSKRSALMSSVREALDRPWALDMDATIKPLHGRREGAQIGCNPHKPGRPSHLLHAFWVGNLRLVLDAMLSSGKHHTSGHAKAAMARLLDELGDKAPALVRGDCGYGNEDSIDVCERRGLRHLLRLRGWSKQRRVLVLRRRIKNDIALTGKRRGHNDHDEQLVPALQHDEVQDSAQVWECTVLATNVGYDIAAIGQL